MALEIPRVVSSAGQVEATAVVTNSGPETRTFYDGTSTYESVVLLDTRGSAVSEGFVRDEPHNDQYDVLPGSSVRLPVTLRARSCGDAQEDERPLPAGEYDAMVVLSASRIGEDGSVHDYDWASPLVRVRVSPRARLADCVAAPQQRRLGPGL